MRAGEISCEGGLGTGSPELVLDRHTSVSYNGSVCSFWGTPRKNPTRPREAMKNSASRHFGLCNPLIIQVGGRHGSPPCLLEPAFRSVRAGRSYGRPPLAKATGGRQAEGFGPQGGVPAVGSLHGFRALASPDGEKHPRSGDRTFCQVHSFSHRPFYTEWQMEKESFLGSSAESVGDPVRRKG